MDFRYFCLKQINLKKTKINCCHFPLKEDLVNESKHARCKSILIDHVQCISLLTLCWFEQTEDFNQGIFHSRYHQIEKASFSNILLKTKLNNMHNAFKLIFTALIWTNNRVPGMFHLYHRIIMRHKYVTKQKWIWVNCYCWGNSSMVEGRFSKWF